MIAKLQNTLYSLHSRCSEGRFDSKEAILGNISAGINLIVLFLYILYHLNKVKFESIYGKNFYQFQFFQFIGLFLPSLLIFKFYVGDKLKIINENVWYRIIYIFSILMIIGLVSTLIAKQYNCHIPGRSSIKMNLDIFPQFLVGVLHFIVFYYHIDNKFLLLFILIFTILVIPRFYLSKSTVIETPKENTPKS